MRCFYFTALVLAAVVSLAACGGTDVVPTAPPATARPLSATQAPATSAAPQTPRAATPGANQPPANPSPSVAANICPFTGMPLNGVQLASRRPLLFKLGNSSPERPQSGLAQADVVVEHLTEGAITRFSAVFYCSDAADIGPIRSARLIDLELVPMFGAIFAHVGGSEPVRQMIAESEIAPADLDDYGRAPIFREIEARKRPFNRYTTTKEMYDLAAKKGLITGARVPAFLFSAEVPPDSNAGDKVTIPYRANLSDAVFEYDPAAKNYLRSTGTTPHVDALSGKQLTAANVVVLFAPHETTTIVEDSLGSRSIKITTTGTGKAILLRDGQSYDVTWTRTDPHALWQFTAASGKPIALKPGNTWIEVAPTTMKVVVE